MATGGDGGEGGVAWDEKGRRFVKGGAYVSYELVAVKGGAAAMDLEHTYVPAADRGGGVAGQLCEAAFRHARERGYLIVPTCSYVSETFLKRNPQWKDLVLQ